MFAEVAASPSPQALKEWLEVLLYLCGLVLTGAGVWRLLRPAATATEIANTPLEVRKHPGVVTRDEFDQTHGRISRERKEIDAAISALRQDAKERTDKLEADLKENTAMTTEMRGEVRQINQSVSTLNTSLTQFLRDQANRK